MTEKLYEKNLLSYKTSMLMKKHKNGTVLCIKILL